MKMFVSIFLIIISVAATVMAHHLALETPDEYDVTIVEGSALEGILDLVNGMYIEDYTFDNVRHYYVPDSDGCLDYIGTASAGYWILCTSSLRTEGWKRRYVLIHSGFIALNSDGCAVDKKSPTFGYDEIGSWGDEIIKYRCDTTTYVHNTWEYWTNSAGNYTVKAHSAAGLKIGGGSVSASYTINSSGLSLSSGPTPSFSVEFADSDEVGITIDQEFINLEFKGITY